MLGDRNCCSYFTNIHSLPFGFIVPKPVFCMCTRFANLLAYTGSLKREHYEPAICKFTRNMICAIETVEFSVKSVLVRTKQVH